jgi:hypothetical protein
VYSGDIATGSIKAGDQANFDRIAAGHEDDWCCRSRRLSRLRGGIATPAMAAGVTDRLWSLEELVDRTSRGAVMRIFWRILLCIVAALVCVTIAAAIRRGTGYDGMCFQWLQSS